MPPSSFDEAITLIRSEFEENDLREWAKAPEAEACFEAHFGLGIWIRNIWIYGGGSALVNEIRDASSSMIQDDDVSELIVRALWRVLNGGPTPSIDELVGGAGP